MAEEKEVYFNIYCQRCKHRDVNENDEPCEDCLTNPANENSHKPVRFEDRDA